MAVHFTIRDHTTNLVTAIVVASAVLILALTGQMTGLLDSRLVHLWLVPAAGVALLLAAYFILRSILQRSVSTGTDQDSLIHYAYHDALTKLPNRLLLRDRLSVQLAATRRSDISVAVLMIDLDEFKVINDDMGHLAGDELLVAVADRIRQSCRDTDTVARLGGDEFVVIQVVEESDQAAVLANRIIASLARPFELGKGQVKVGCSIGITITQSADAGLESLIEEADLALYRSKKLGGNVVTIFDPNSGILSRTEKDLETELIKALENSDVTVHFARQVNRQGQLLGVDARLAWTHPSLGALDLTAILASVHDRRLATSVVDHYLASVAEAGAGLPALQLTFNMLPFVNPDRELVDQLCGDEFNLLRRASACFLAIGMNELERSALRGVALVEELESHGYGLLFDCSEGSPVTLRTITRLRPSRLRLNSQLVAMLPTADHASRTVQALCKLAFSEAIEIVADGVTTPEQSTILQDLGCEIQQGPFWGGVSDLAEIAGNRPGIRAFA